jgi:hypothetical protein
VSGADWIFWIAVGVLGWGLYMVFGMVFGVL